MKIEEYILDYIEATRGIHGLSNTRIGMVCASSPVFIQGIKKGKAMTTKSLSTIIDLLELNGCKNPFILRDLTDVKNLKK